MAKKGGILHALFKKRRMKKETESKERYLKHYKTAGPKHAMTYAQWKKEGEEHLYYKLPRLRRKSVEARLRESGVNPERFRKKQKK